MRTLRLAALCLGLVAAAAGAAAWRTPQFLDGALFHARVADFAARRIGRDVSIGGQVRLELAHGPALVARDVVIADRGDGIAARVHALRLDLGLAEMLRLRLVAHALVLDRPVVTLPWPLPRPAAPAVPRGFSATVENGAVTLGGLRFTAVDAALQSDPDTGAFTTQGNATLGALTWRFNMLLGAPGRDGAAALAVTLDGQGAARGIGGTLRGRIAPDGGFAGQISLRGGDLSRLIAAPAVAFSLQGPITLAGGIVRADDLALLLAGSAGHGALTWHATPPLRLQTTAALGQIDLGPWLAALTGGGAPFPVQARLTAQAAHWRGATLRDAAAELEFGPAGAALRAARLALPGGGALSLQGAVTGPAPHFTGKIHAQANDMGAVLGWLDPSAAGLLGEAPGPADLTADLAVSAQDVALTAMTAHASGATLTGGARYGLAKPALTLDLALDQLRLPADPLAVLASTGGGWAPPPTHLLLRLSHASWRGLALTNTVLDAETGPTGVTLHQASLEAAAAQLKASGALGWDGTLAAAHLDITAADANAMLLNLPPSWRFMPRLFFGPGHLAISAAGPANAITAQVLTDLNDLRIEGELKLDPGHATASATATLRHPSAPTLLAALGLAGADRWIDRGSLALTAHLTLAPGQVAAPDFSLSAGVMRLYGDGRADLDGAVPFITTHLHAETLPLPAMSPHDTTVLPLDLLAGWQGVAEVNAAQVLADLQPVARNAAARLTLSGGVVLADAVTAEVAEGGKLAAVAVLDSTQAAPALLLTGGVIGAALPESADPALPFLPHGGSISVVGDIATAGFSPAAMLAGLSGDIDGALTGVTFSGVDLAALAHALGLPPGKARAALSAGLSAGVSPGLSGPFKAALDKGLLTYQDVHLQGAQGALETAGVFDLVEKSGEMKLRLLPNVANPPPLGVTLSGPWDAMRRSVDVAPGVAWMGKKK